MEKKKKKNFPAPFQDGFGLITIHGIPKPAFRAFELLHQTGNFRVNVDPPLGASGNTLDLVATQNGGENGNTVSLLLTNWDIPSNPVAEETACVVKKKNNPFFILLKKKKKIKLDIKKKNSSKKKKKKDFGGGL